MKSTKYARMLNVGDKVTVAHGMQTQIARFTIGEVLTLTMVSGGYVTAEAADGRKVQTWLGSFVEGKD